MSIYDPEIVTSDDKNAIETPFLAVLSPQKGMRGIPIGFWEKSNCFGSIGSLKGAKLPILFRRSFKSPPPSCRVNRNPHFYFKSFSGSKESRDEVKTT